MRFLVRGGGGGGEGGKGVYKFSSQIFFWRSEFSRFGRGGGVVVWVFLVGLSSEFLGLSSKVWVF